MNKRARRGLSAIAIAAGVLALGPQPGSSAEGPAETTVTVVSGRIDIRLSQTDTGAAAESFAAAEATCAKLNLTVYGVYLVTQRLNYPSCPVAVQVCAMAALDTGQPGVVHAYHDYFDCED